MKEKQPLIGTFLLLRSVTPRPSRPVSRSADDKNVDKPVQPAQTGQEPVSKPALIPEPTPGTSGSPSGSRPPSVSLRDALAMIFGGNDLCVAFLVTTESVTDMVCCGVVCCIVFNYKV